MVCFTRQCVWQHCHMQQILLTKVNPHPRIPPAWGNPGTMGHCDIFSCPQNTHTHTHFTMPLQTFVGYSPLQLHTSEFKLDHNSHFTVIVPIFLSTWSITVQEHMHTHTIIEVSLIISTPNMCTDTSESMTLICSQSETSLLWLCVCTSMCVCVCYPRCYPVAVLHMWSSRPSSYEDYPWRCSRGLSDWQVLS